MPYTFATFLLPPTDVRALGQGLRAPITSLEKLAAQQHVLYLVAAPAKIAVGDDLETGHSRSSLIKVSGGLKVGVKQIFVANVRFLSMHLS